MWKTGGGLAFLPRLSVTIVQRSDAGRWHDPCPDAEKSAFGGIPRPLRGRRGCTVQGDTASLGARNPPHPSRDSRTAHKPRHPGSAGWICPRRTNRVPRAVLQGAMAGATPSADGETSPFTARRMSSSRAGPALSCRRTRTSTTPRYDPGHTVCGGTTPRFRASFLKISRPRGATRLSVWLPPLLVSPTLSRVHDCRPVYLTRRRCHSVIRVPSVPQSSQR